MTEVNDNYFLALNSIDVSEKVESKGKFNYLSWTWAWTELKKRHPDATYTVYENPEGLFYHTDGRTCWVKTGVTVNGIEHIEYLPVMDINNRSISLDRVTSVEVNKAIQRSVTKAIARHGLGLYIYAGEDLPEDAKQEAAANNATVATKQPPKYLCTTCGQEILPVKYKGEEYGRMRIEQESLKAYGRPMCWTCMKKAKEEQNNG